MGCEWICIKTKQKQATWKSQRFMSGFKSDKQLVDATNGFQTDGKCKRSYTICIQGVGMCKDATLHHWCFYTNILRAKYSSKPFNHWFLNRLQSLTWQADSSKRQQEVTVYTQNSCIISKLHTARSCLLTQALIALCQRTPKGWERQKM